MAEKEGIILYAEDTPVVREGGVNMLRAYFPTFELETFEDGTSLEERLNQDLSGVKIVVLDDDMPEISGSEIIRRYATREEFEGIPFILHYGGDKSIGERALENGARAYVLKPDSFYGEVRRALVIL